MNSDRDVEQVDDAAHGDTSSQPSKPLRVWPAIVAIVAMWLLKFVPRLFEQSMTTLMLGFMGPLICAALVVIWWIGLSRASWFEKIIGVLGLAAVGFVANILSDESIQGTFFSLFSLPWGITAFALGVILFRFRGSPNRAIAGLLAAAVGFGCWDLIRVDEVRGDFRTARDWRWTESPEDKFLASLESRPSTPSDAQADLSFPDAPEWPGFRGASRDGKQPGIVLSSDWKANPPKELWRIRMGPGWSSFSVAGDRVYTQEQRGEKEAIVCLDARNGQMLWLHEYESRFWEAVGGAGPRATPTLADGALFALGANGELHRLDPATGEVEWFRDIREVANREPPTWGFSASPLVTHGLVVVHAGGEGDKGILAYDTETGELRWSAPAGDDSYSSPQLNEVCGRSAILTLTNRELSIVDPITGSVLGEHEWQYEQYRVIQPLVLGNNSVVIGTGMPKGTRLVELELEADQITTAEVWTTTRLNPNFNDFVTHQGYLYGFDNNVFTCIDLETAERQWKGGRYGFGQVVLLPQEGQLLVISEDGELVLLRTNPEQHEELTRIRVLDGRTWNHPVIVGNRLFVRNAKEAACFEMPVLSTPEA